ncbi:WYL domain-containing protein [Methyloversatilis sp.]|uniref:helix-turn-helix transcriptional regulator n=3 Tax=Methyloversatilis sp. TaxID=2569862 RepID=UPI002733B4D9|nr:WYL domain-containing protein [Methyloversatilis sp.]MDP3454401.1 WYL domain-containing protein [Methyloversatilis sp.]MDP3578733.1 WYL domain-containing protein [Methyloversatilis sp.]
MSRTDRLHRLAALLSPHRVIPFDRLQSELAVSRATLTRDITYLRDVLCMPLEFDRDRGGYFLDLRQGSGGQLELANLWFSSTEIHALLTMQHLLANLDPGGILTRHVEPLMERLNKLLGAAKNDAAAVRERVLIVGQGKRPITLKHFERIGSALLQRKRLIIIYAARGSATVTEREISPQRLVHYRENWYLEAWCHLRRELRRFAVDAIREAHLLDRTAREVGGRTLKTVFGPAYGIFSGKQIEWARLRFSPERARWVAHEAWHPKQKGRFDNDGYYLLEIPYADHRELLMDILKHGRHCEVLGPEALREEVRSEILKLGELYGQGL